MIPGSVQEVKYKKKYMQAKLIKRIRGRAGVTFQLSPTTKMQKGIRAMRVHT
jgi:hypothetical protein